MKRKIIILLLGSIPFLTGFVYEDTNLTVTVGEVDVPVYNIDITWDSMEFIYRETINYEWNDKNFTYDITASNYMWNSYSDEIKIQNKSAFLVNVSLKYNSINSNISGTFDSEKITLNKNESRISKLLLNGKLPSDNTTFIKVGTIDLSIY